MASQTFTLAHDGDTESATLTVAAGKALRVRFSDFEGYRFGNPVVPFLKIARDSVTTRHLIDSIDGWFTEGVDEGDVVSVEIEFKGAEISVSGILEEIAR